MKRGVKILLILAGSGAALVALLGVGGVWWWHANRDRLRVQGAAIRQAGRAFGDHRDSAACLNESLLRLDRKSGLVEDAYTNIFLKSCLATAARDPALCAGVPAEREIMASVRWRMSECSRYGRPKDERCGRLLSAIQDVCHER